MPLDNLTALKSRVPGGKYLLAKAVAERAHQLQNGDSLPLVEVKTPNPITVAIEEIIQGKVSFEINAEKAVEASEGQDLAAPESFEETLLAVPDQADDAVAPDAGLGADVDATIKEANS